jgi:hypothetical protein
MFCYISQYLADPASLFRRRRGFSGAFSIDRQGDYSCPVSGKMREDFDEGCFVVLSCPQAGLCLRRKAAGIVVGVDDGHENRNGFA